MLTMKWAIAPALLLLAACNTTGDNTSRLIKVPVPERPAGQEDMIGFAAEPLDSVRVGIIGLGMRGPGAVERMLNIEGVAIKALCDIEPERCDSAQAMILRAGAPAADIYTGNDSVWRQLVERPDLDLIYIATDWKKHALMGKAGMEAGKHVAIEVPAAMTLDEIWDLINTSEQTRRHCMMLENCVYDFFELNTLNMAQNGVFGDLVHVEGSYIHNLSEFWDAYYDNWRLDYNHENRGDVYATHGMGPACQLLDMHRGDRMVTLVAMDSDPFTGPGIVERQTGTRPDDFKNGDHTMTMIRTDKGKTIHIQHDVMNPRPYSRMYQLTGTKGFANKYGREGYALEPDSSTINAVPDLYNLSAHDWLSDEQQAALVERYRHPFIDEVGEIARKVGGHGGMDYIMDYRLIYCLRNGLPLDMDVYDLAEWCSLAPLTQLSIDNGSAPVAVPDFTRGGWNKLDGYRQAHL
ncbi:MAG: Gfo/Idh/MocA family oxidoreductase [Muribaculaceae bacterium]|nr:Gfo/Idh/MocA family oxidoreductase [Muribaculaceae bacterium]